MPLFVILEHDWPFLHWDFMLENEGRLWTWRLDIAPRTGQMIAAERLPDHRIEYLEYEGPVSGDRGTVRRWDRGEYAVFSTIGEKVEQELTFTLSGERIHASVIVSAWKGPRSTMRFLPPDSN